MLSAIYAGIERGEEPRNPSPRGSNPSIAKSQFFTQIKAEEKDPLAVVPLEKVALDGPEKFTYASSLITDDEKE